MNKNISLQSIVNKWFIKNLIINNRRGLNIVFLVPTRALVSQTLKKLKHVVEDVEGYFLSSSPDIPALLHKRNPHYIFVFTPERLLHYFSVVTNPTIEYVFVPAFSSKLNNLERSYCEPFTLAMTTSTPIDFAYMIHSAVGNKMVGAKVDGRIVPLDYNVKTGEIVEIMTSSQQGKGPSRDWLNIVKTSQARSKIRQWFKKECREENIIEGKSQVEREFKRNFIRLSEADYNEFVLKIAERQHCKSIEDFYAAIGYGGISVMRMVPKIKEDYAKLTKAVEPVITITPVKKKTKSKEGVIVEGIDNCLIKFSRCCNPLPGDNIIGFITRGHGVSIHKRDCTNVPKDIVNCAEPARWVNAFWNQNVREDYKATLQLTCLSRVGLMAEVAIQVANMRVNITSISTHDMKDGRTIVELTVNVSGIDHLKNLISRIEKVDGILSVER